MCVFHSMSMGKFSSPKEHCPSFVRKTDSHSSGFLLVHDLLIGIKVITVISLCLFFPLSQPLYVLSLSICICTYTCVYIKMACVYTCITPHVISIYLSQLFTYTCPRTTLFNRKPFISLKNFNMLPVSFLCISLTTGNLVINLNGQNIVIFRKQGDQFCTYSYFTLLCLYKGLWALCAIYTFFQWRWSTKKSMRKIRGNRCLNLLRHRRIKFQRRLRRCRVRWVFLFCYQLFSANLMFYHWKEPLQWFLRFRASRRKYTALARPRNLH